MTSPRLSQWKNVRSVLQIAILKGVRGWDLCSLRMRTHTLLVQAVMALATWILSNCLLAPTMVHSAAPLRPGLAVTTPVRSSASRSRCNPPPYASQLAGICWLAETAARG